MTRANWKVRTGSAAFVEASFDSSYLKRKLIGNAEVTYAALPPNQSTAKDKSSFAQEKTKQCKIKNTFDKKSMVTTNLMYEYIQLGERVVGQWQVILQCDWKCDHVWYIREIRVFFDAQYSSPLCYHPHISMDVIFVPIYYWLTNEVVRSAISWPKLCMVFTNWHTNLPSVVMTHNLPCFS